MVALIGTTQDYYSSRSNEMHLCWIINRKSSISKRLGIQYKHEIFVINKSRKRVKMNYGGIFIILASVVLIGACALAKENKKDERRRNGERSGCMTVIFGDGGHGDSGDGWGGGGGEGGGGCGDCGGGGGD